jgi:uncharacterized protein YceK
MNGTRRGALALLIVFALGGCGSIYNIDDRHEPMGGVKTDLEIGFGVPLLLPLLPMDLPLSFAIDLVSLPWVIPAHRKDEEDRRRLREAHEAQVRRAAGRYHFRAEGLEGTLVIEMKDASTLRGSLQIPGRGEISVGEVTAVDERVFFYETEKAPDGGLKAVLVELFRNRETGALEGMIGRDGGPRPFVAERAGT